MSGGGAEVFFTREDWAYEIKGVAFYASPWVTGTRAAAYFGPISSQVFIANPVHSPEWFDLFDKVFANVAWKAKSLTLLEKREKRAWPACVGCEFTVDPFFERPNSDVKGTMVYLMGTCARLEPIF